jgi:hypothetical protein
MGDVRYVYLGGPRADEDEEDHDGDDQADGDDEVGKEDQEEAEEVVDEEEEEGGRWPTTGEEEAGEELRERLLWRVSLRAVRRAHLGQRCGSKHAWWNSAWQRAHLVVVRSCRRATPAVRNVVCRVSCVACVVCRVSVSYVGGSTWNG